MTDLTILMAVIALALWPRCDFQFFASVTSVKSVETVWTV